MDTSSEMLRLQMKALDSSFHTDCSFLVSWGPERPDMPSQAVHAFKGPLSVGSETFRKAFADPKFNPSAGPIPVTNIDPAIFKRMIEFIHSSCCPIDRIQEALYLSSAAERFKVRALSNLCSPALEKMILVDNVWPILNAFLGCQHSSQIVHRCTQVLCTETMKCLQHPSFEKVSDKVLVFFLQLESLDIISESALVEACLRLAATKSEANALAMMKQAIPHLRLLNVDFDQIRPLAKYLSKMEWTGLQVRREFSDCPGFMFLPNSLSRICRKRQQTETFVLKLVSDQILENAEDRKLYKTRNTSESFGLLFTVSQNMWLKSLSLLSHWTCLQESEDVAAIIRNGIVKQKQYLEDLHVQVSIGKNEENYKIVSEGKVAGLKDFNSSFSYVFNSEHFLQAGTECLIQVTLQKNELEYLKMAMPKVLLHPMSEGLVQKVSLDHSFLVDNDWASLPEAHTCPIQSVTFILEQAKDNFGF